MIIPTQPPTKRPSQAKTLNGSLPTALVLAVGALVSLGAYWIAARWAGQERSQRFAEEASVQAQAIQARLDSVLVSVEAVAQFYKASEDIGPDELKLFVQPFVGGSATIQALEWIPRVTDAERAALETRARQEGLADFAIRERRDGRLVPASRRPEYYPVYRVEPLHGNVAAVGFDLASGPVRRAALERARDSGRPAASAPLTLVQETGSQRGMIVFVPVAVGGHLGKTPLERRERLDGFALGVVRMGDLVEGALARLPATDRIASCLRDPALPGAAGRLHLRGCKDEAGSTLDATRVEHADLKKLSRLQLADRALELTAIPMPGAYRPSGWPLAVLALGLLISTAGTGFLAYRRRALASLREQEALFRLFMDHNSALAWIKDQDGRYLYANRVFEEQVGLQPGAWRGMTDSDIWPQQLATVFTADDQTVLKTGRPARISESSPGNDGTGARSWDTLKLPIQGPAGRRYVGGLSIDVTAQRRTELELRLYKQIVDNASEMLLYIDRDGRYQVVNPAYAKFQQKDPDSFGGRLVKDVEHPEVWAQIEPHLQAALGGESQRFRAKGRAPSGEPRYTEVHHCPFVEDGEVRGVVVSLHEITEIERARATLESQHAELEAQVAARTAELRASESKLRTMLDLLPIGISITDPAGRIVDCNPASERLLGTCLERHLGQDDQGNDWSTIRPDGTAMPAGDYASVRAMAEQRLVRDVEMGIVRPEGITWLSVSAMPTPHPDYGVVAAYVDVTERRRAEEALRASEQRWKFALEGPGDGIWDWDVRSGKVFFSHGWKAMLGFAEDELAPELVTWKTRVHPDDKARVFAALQPHLDGETSSYASEHRMRCKNGDWKWVLDRGMVVERTADGAPLRAIGTHSDISERKAAETELKRLTERLQLATEVGGIGVWEWDLRQNRLTWDARIFELHGLQGSHIEPSYEVWINAVHPEDRARMEACSQRARHSTESLVETFRIVRPDGSVRHIAAASRAILDQDGTPTRVLGVKWDVTEERLAAAELEASEARARTIIDVSPVPMAICNGTREIGYLNPAFVATFGYSHAEIPTLDAWWPRAYPDAAYCQSIQAAWRRQLDRVLADDSAFEPMEVEIHCKDGSTRTVMVTAVPLGGRYEDQFLASFYDVTDLRRARETAEEAVRLKSQFLANVSHEIRTPMNAMLGLTQVLEGEPLSGDQRTMVGQIRAATSSLLEIINDVLDFSKIEAGRLQLDPRPFELAEVLTYVRDLIGPMARAKGLAFEVDAAQAPSGRLHGDPLRLQQILVNLTGNAVKFTERGRVGLKVQLRSSDPRGVRLRFAAEDTGIGIAEGQIAQICEPFQQADGGISRRFGGTGLGLSITRQLTQLMGGTFGIESQLGIGSEIWVELPFEHASESPETPAEGPPPLAAAGPRLAGLHLLVVDDSRLNLDVVERVLKREGGRATLAEDGEGALEVLRRRAAEIDAVLMDIQMPKMDGLTAARAIRGELGLTRLPLIAFTAGVLTEQRQAAAEAGFDDFLAKPVDLDAMVRALRRWLSPKPSAPAAAAPPRGQQAFPEVAGLDVQRAEQLLDRDRAFFIELLGRFAEDQDETARHVRRDIEAGDPTAAAHRLHRLRTLGGNIGALELLAASERLETAIHAREPDLEPLLADFETRLKVLLTAIAPWRDAPASDAHNDGCGPPDPGQLQALRDALARRDLAALSLLEALRPALTTRMGETGASAIAEAVRALRFEEALHQLDEGHDLH